MEKQSVTQVREDTPDDRPSQNALTLKCVHRVHDRDHATIAAQPLTDGACFEMQPVKEHSSLV